MSAEISNQDLATFISQGYGFHDLLTAVWDRTKNDNKVFTKRQREWIKNYFSVLANETSIPYCTDIARALKTTPSSSARIKKRIEKKLRSYQIIVAEEEEESARDVLIEAAYKRIERDLSPVPEYFEQRRGTKGIIHWKLVTAFHERTGQDYKTRYAGEEVKKEDLGYSIIPVVKTSMHSPSPGSIWLDDKIKQHAQEQGVTYQEAYILLSAQYYSSWPEEKAHNERFCRTCSCLLPLGETIEGKRIKKNSLYCSNRCKIYAHRKR